MKILLATILAIASAACLAGPACEKPEYAQLKDMSKSELRDQYCSALRFAKLNDQEKDGLRKVERDMMEKGIYAPKGAEVLEVTRTASACRVIAATFEERLAKRYKAKPPASCD